MAQAAKIHTKREPAMLYRRIETKLGVSPLRSDRDLARLVEGFGLGFLRISRGSGKQGGSGQGCQGQ